VLTNYFTQGVIIPAAFTNAGDTGLATGVVYFAIAIDETTNTDYTAAMITNSITSFTENLVRFVGVQIGTNTFTLFEINENTQWDPVSSTNIYKTTHRIISAKQTYVITAE
jgi:hypothetical protein